MWYLLFDYTNSSLFLFQIFSSLRHFLNSLHILCFEILCFFHFSVHLIFYYCFLKHVCVCVYSPKGFSVFKFLIFHLKSSFLSFVFHIFYHELILSTLIISVNTFFKSFFAFFLQEPLAKFIITFISKFFIKNLKKVKFTLSIS